MNDGPGYVYVDPLVVDLSLRPFAAAVLLASQYLATIRAKLSGAALLHLEVLDNAVSMVEKAAVQAVVGRRLARQASEDWQWFLSDDDVWLFSFVRCCDVVGIDPAYFRRG